MSSKVEFEIGGRTMTIESGRLAKQANGAVTVQYGDSMVISTVCAGTEPRLGFDFFPLHLSSGIFFVAEVVCDDQIVVP